MCKTPEDLDLNGIDTVAVDLETYDPNLKTKGLGAIRGEIGFGNTNIRLLFFVGEELYRKTVSVRHSISIFFFVRWGSQSNGFLDSGRCLDISGSRPLPSPISPLSLNCINIPVMNSG